MHTDPIADLLTRIRNGYSASHQSITVSHSKLKESLLKIIKDHNFIEGFEVEEEGNFKILSITLKDSVKGLHFKRVSKPGQRIYMKSIDLKPIKSGLGISILSTSKGLMTNNEARKSKLGGELICEIF